MQPPPGGSGWGPPPGAPPPAAPPGGGRPVGWSTPSAHGPPGGYGLALPPGVNVQTAYAAPGGGGQTEPLGIVSLVLGVLTIPLYFCCGVFGMVINVVLNLAGIVTALVALGRIKGRPEQSKAMPIAGLVLNGLLLLVSIGLVIFFVGIMGVGLLASP